MYKARFSDYLHEHNVEGSGKAASYLKALEQLRRMLAVEPHGFEDCKDIWSTTSVERLRELREFVLVEQKKLDSRWRSEQIPASYLRNGFCAAALSKLIDFLPLYLHSEKALQLFHDHKGEESSLAEKLNFEPILTAGSEFGDLTELGRDSLRTAKARIGQYAFRRIILLNYRNRCCITGLDIPAVLRASHIVSWSQRKRTRMDPRNGLCLSATYDAAFDRHLISIDERFRLLISNDISDHYTSESVNEYFYKRRGQQIELPNNYKPLGEYLEHHRKAGNF